MATGMPHPSKASSRMASGFQGRVVKPHTPKLVREVEKPATLTPSAFQKEMSLTTKQRLASTKKLKLPQVVQPKDKSETSHQTVSAVDLFQSSLQISPPEVVFQNFVPGETCEMSLVLRNRDQAPQMVRVTMESSPYFQLVGPSGVCRKVPPGLFVTVHVLFTPEQNKDYFHQLLCITKREEFIVPIWAIGARAFLDFPDQLDFSVCPVKYSTQKTLQVHNLGKRTVYYHISTQSPFSVGPTVGSLDIGDTMLVTVEFQPLKTGDYSTPLVVHYDTGEDIHTSLHGTAVDVHIRLDRNSVTVEKTYITLSNCATVLIHNRSDITAYFQWKAFDTQEEEDQLKLRHYHRLCRRETHNFCGFLRQHRVDTTRRERFALLSRILQSERAKVQGDPMLFNSDIFSLEPKEGEVRPNCSAEITVFFKPQEARVYKQAVYCDISGRETRLPLLLTGEGLGPWLHFRFEELDTGKVFLRAVHRYEAILLNKGPIEGSFSLVPPTTRIGSCFTFLPQEGIVPPNGLQAIQISFCPAVLGEFKEEFNFSVAGTSKRVIFTIKGLVIGPTFHFDVPALQFGDVSFGFPNTLKCCLFNTSLAPLAFNLRIPQDGSGELSISSFAQMFQTTRQPQREGPKGLMKPKEFKINPCRGTICPLASQDIEVTLCSNTVGEYKGELVVDVDGVGERVSALSLTARCIVPPLRVLNSTVTFGRCCVKVPYEKKLTFVNDSDVPGCYILVPQKDKEKAPAWYSSSVPSGIVEAHSSLEVPLTIEAQMLGDCSITAGIAVFGREQSPLEIHFECIGQGPVVCVHPRQINFGTIQVLQDNSKPLQLANQSGIPAMFWTELAGKCSCWRIEPSKGVVPPYSEVSVIVTANLDDMGKFQDKLKVFIENSYTNFIPVQAVGIGTTIVTDKPFAPVLSLGPCFSFTPCHFEFKVTNKGRQNHQLYWTTEGFKIFRQTSRPPALGGTKNKNASQIPRPGSPVFKLQPVQLDLKPNETAEMVLEGCSSTAQEVKERLLCHAIVGKEKAKKQIMQVDVTCKFIFPVVEISSRVINFRVEKKPSDVLTLQYKPLSFKNTSSLPLSIVLNLEQPFQICDVDQQPLHADSEPMTLDAGEELHLCIQFNPAYENNLYSRVAKRALRMGFVEHPHEERITVHGEVYFPNLHLQTKALDFGCIMNDTEQVLYMEMTNCSPIPVKYHWSFQTDSQVNTIRFNPSPPKFKPQSLKKKGPFARKYSGIESSEEPTEDLEIMQDSSQESPVQESPVQESPVQEGSAQEGSVQEGSAKDSSAQGDSAQDSSAQDDSAQEGSAQEDSSQEASAQDSSSQKDSSQKSSSQQSSDAQDSLDTEVLSSTTSEPKSLMRMRRFRQFSEVGHLALGMEEVFDVLPLWGELLPGQSQQVSFTFFGHANIVARVKALCHVEGGPTYEVTLAGEASYPSYQLDLNEIDFGLQLFNEVLEEEVTLRNTGVVEFTYVVSNAGTGTAANLLPGVPVVMPTTGSIAPGKKQVLKIYYLPGRLRVFCSTFQVQVSFLEPVDILLKGEGTFPRITVDLPWMLKGNEKYKKILKEIRKNMKRHVEDNEPYSPCNTSDLERRMDDSDDEEEEDEEEEEEEGEEEEEEEEEEEQEGQEEQEEEEEEDQYSLSERQYSLSEEQYSLFIRDSKKENKKILLEEEENPEEEEGNSEEEESSEEEETQSSESSYLGSSVTMGSSMKSSTDESGTVEETWMQMQIEEKLIENRIRELERAVTSRAPKDRVFNKRIRQSLLDIELPEYILNMGRVRVKESKSRIVKITNPGLVPVSFQVNGSVLRGTGFSVEPDKVQGLTYCRSCELTVRFDSSKLQVGDVDVVLPIKVAGGYTVRIHISATVIDSCSEETKPIFSTKFRLSSERSESYDNESLRSDTA